MRAFALAAAVALGTSGAMAQGNEGVQALAENPESINLSQAINGEAIKRLCAEISIDCSGIANIGDEEVVVPKFTPTPSIEEIIKHAANAAAAFEEPITNDAAPAGKKLQRFVPGGN